MRTLSLICAILAAALSILAMFGVLYSAVLNRTDREASIGAYYLLFAATPVALITAALSLAQMASSSLLWSICLFCRDWRPVDDCERLI